MSTNWLSSDYSLKIKQLPLWKKALLVNTITTGSCITYYIGSYYFNKLRYPKMPSVDYKIYGDIKSNAGILLFIH